MALEAKKYNRMFSTTGSDADKIDSEKLTRIETKFNNNDYLEDEDNFETLAPVLFQMQKFTEEFDSIRDHVVNDIVGQQGPQGDTGPQGPQGDTGPQGPSGAKGDTGATGARGATGAAGAAGADGTDGVAGADGKDAGLYTTTKGKTTIEEVFIPSSYFVGADYGAYGAPDGTSISNARGTLNAMWPGIDGKTVDKVFVHTDSRKAIPTCVTVSKFALGTSTILASRASSDTLIDITDWPCAVTESLSISIAPGSTTIKIYGASLILK